VIILTRLGGHTLAVNPDLIERAEPTPDTVLTMIDGHKIVVAESVDDVVELVRAWRASVAAQAYSLARCSDLQDAVLRHPSRYAGEEPDPEEELGIHVAAQSTLARVLRLPQRGE
jgi:flagellar protein FlbD